MRTRVTILAVALAVCGAMADTVYLKDGRIFRGRVEQTGDSILLHMEYGTLEYPLEEIDRIEYEPRYEEEYRRRLAAIDRTDPDKLFELSLWCAEHDLSAEGDELLHKVLALEPHHTRAREALGYVQVGGEARQG